MTVTELTASRRALLAATGAGALALCLGGCGAGSSPTSTSGGTSGGEGTTVPAADVPVGSGIIVGSYVITQPTEGSYEAFSSRCTHQGLPVQEVTDAAIVCGHHGSTFSLADGSVITGPATQPLTAATVTLDGDTLTIS